MARTATVVASRTNNGPDEWVTFGEYCRIARIGERTGRRYIAEGKIRAYRVAGERLIRIRRSDIDALFEPIPVGGDVA